MNLKNILTLSALAVAGAATAAVSSDNTLCRIEVASATTNTIVAVPLKTVAGSAGSIKLTDLVQTNGLSNGDYLLHKSDSRWEAWQIVNGAWESVAVSDQNVTSIAGTDTALTLGDAVWLVRKDPSGSFYLFGEVASSTAALPTITRDPSNPTYIMMGNTALTNVAVTALSIVGVKGDKIAVPATTGAGIKEYTYSGSEWQEAVIRVTDGKASATMQTATGTIPAGQGFWYIATASGSSN